MDPCRNSTVNLIEPLITEFAVPQGRAKKAQLFDGPTDSIGLFYGNGYDRCGPLKYDFTYHEVEGGVFDMDLFTETVGNKRPSSFDILEWELTSET